MKKSLLSVALALMSVASVYAQVQSLNVVGYVNKTFAPGDTLFTPPLWAANNYSGPQYLSQIFGADTPHGTAISLWSALTSSYLPASTYSAILDEWSIDYDLHVGIGARLTASTQFTQTFVGEVDGRFNVNSPAPVPHSGLSDGIHLLGNIVPQALSGDATFENVIGRAPVDGEQIIKLDNTYTYDGMVWRDQDYLVAAPTLAVAEAAFFNLGPVPEPSTLALAGMGLAALLTLRRRS